jgi:hypothetical protein
MSDMGCLAGIEGGVGLLAAQGVDIPAHTQPSDLNPSAAPSHVIEKASPSHDHHISVT